MGAVPPPTGTRGTLTTAVKLESGVQLPRCRAQSDAFPPGSINRTSSARPGSTAGCSRSRRHCVSRTLPLLLTCRRELVGENSHGTAVGRPWGWGACYLHTEIGVWLQRLKLLWSLKAESSPSVPCIPSMCPGSMGMLTCPVTGCRRLGRAWHGAVGAGLQQGTSSAGRSQGAEMEQVNVCPTSCSTSWVCSHSRSHAAASAWGEGSVWGLPGVLVHHSVCTWPSIPMDVPPQCGYHGRRGTGWPAAGPGSLARPAGGEERTEK